jgi:hypothetical protein
MRGIPYMINQIDLQEVLKAMEIRAIKKAPEMAQ